jgi:hypothetical protein
MGKPTIASLADVCRHFGADPATNEALDRRVYKDTSCGAWAKVTRVPVFTDLYERWVCRYRRRSDGAWDAAHVERDEDGAPMAFALAPEDVRRYFDPKDPEAQDRLAELAEEGGETLSVDATLRVRMVTGTVLQFTIGSIDEGSDAEVGPVVVNLPCSPKDLNDAVQWVENEADRMREADELEGTT